MAIVPATFATVFEIVRAGFDGPMVDGIRPSGYGLLAAASGRGFHALVALVPMVLGASVGAGLARRGTPGPRPVGARRVGRAARRGVAVLTALGLVALSIGLARPATTDAIVDAEGDVIPGSVAELTSVEVDGHDLGMLAVQERPDLYRGFVGSGQMVSQRGG